RDTNGLANENTELRLRLQSMEQQALLRNALNGEALRKEVERMKIETGEVSGNSESSDTGIMQQIQYSPSTFTVSIMPGFAVQSKPANGEVEFSERVRVSTERTVASGLEISSNNSSSIFKSEGPSLSSSAY
ncbi:hypothetical protein HID58_037632, partial [Brassica napus]